jgi:hypothetical protein
MVLMAGAVLALIFLWKRRRQSQAAYRRSARESSAHRESAPDQYLDGSIVQTTEDGLQEIGTESKYELPGSDAALIRIES